MAPFFHLGAILVSINGSTKTGAPAAAPQPFPIHKENL